MPIGTRRFRECVCAFSPPHRRYAVQATINVVLLVHRGVPRGVHTGAVYNGWIPAFASP